MKNLSLLILFFAIFLICMPSFSRDDNKGKAFYTPEEIKQRLLPPKTPEELQVQREQQKKMYIAYLNSLKKLSKIATVPPNWQPYMSPVDDQGQEPLCLIYACCAVVEGQLQITHGAVIGEGIDLDELELYDPLFYWGYSAGPTLDDIEDDKVGSEIGSYPNWEGAKWTISSHTDHIIQGTQRIHIKGIDSLKAHLENGPIVADFEVYDDFQPFFVSHPTEVYHYDGESDYYGSHAVAIVSYYEDTQNPENSYWLCKNSWGENWGDDGYFRLGFGECGIESPSNWVVTADESCLAKFIPELQDFQPAMDAEWANDEEAFMINNTIVSSNITVPSDGMLNIKSGVAVEIAAGKNIKVYGTIKAIGTSLYPVYFERNGSSQWDAIYLYGDNNRFKHCVFDDGTYTVKPILSENNVFDDCVFMNSYCGIRVYNTSEVLIKNSEFYNNTYGIHIYGYNDVELIGNEIYNNSTGLYISRENFVKAYGNVIENNSGNGLYTYNKDIIHLGLPFEWGGKNTIRNNGGYNLNKSSSEPRLELAKASIHRASGCDLYLYGAPTTYALQCWYGTDGMDKDGSGAIQNIMQLTTTPSWEGHTYNDYTNLYKSIPEFDTNPESIPDKYRGAEGISALKTILKDEQSLERDKIKALDDLYCVLRADYRDNSYGERDQFNIFLEELITINSSKELSDLALSCQANWMTLQGEYNEAIAINKMLLVNNTGNEKLDIMIELALLYNTTGLKNEALSMLDSIVDEFGTENEEVKNLFDILNVESDIRYADESAEIPGAFLLTQNYPNPFNPTTTIQYGLSKDSHVKLTVFNINGQKIKELVNENKTAGVYSVTFDGNQLASGVYFYRIQAGDFVQTKRMLLIK